MAKGTRVKIVLSVAAAVALALSSATNPEAAQQPPIFSSRAELVVLHVAVTDRRGAYVSGLDASAFHVAENKQPQKIEFFAPEDAPVTMGLLIDSSGSMAAVRDRVIAAVSAFIEASNPRDEVFAVVFNDDVTPVLADSTPFTGDADVLRRALADVFVPAGRTALYDGIDAGLRYVARGSRDRRVLVALTDGGDNASHVGLVGALRAAGASNTLIYTIAIADASDPDANPKALAQFAEVTGGMAFQPRTAPDINAAFQKIASDVRHAYTIGYVPSDAGVPGFRRISVAVHAPDGNTLNARTRNGYHGR